MSSGIQLLHDKILSLSEEQVDIRAAADEWRSSFCNEDNTECLCGHKIQRVFRAVNAVNGNVLQPLGSVCIKKFSEAYGLDTSEFYRSFEKAQRVECPDCGISIINQTAFNVHIHTQKHLKNIGSWPCLDCGIRITNDKPKWMTRCLRCYKKHCH